MTDNAALVFNRSNAMTVSNAISGPGTVTLSAGTVTLSGASSYGATTVNAGQLIIGNTLTNSGAIDGGRRGRFAIKLHVECRRANYIGYLDNRAGTYVQSGGTDAVSGIE